MYHFIHLFQGNCCYRVTVLHGQNRSKYNTMIEHLAFSLSVHHDKLPQTLNSGNVFDIHIYIYVYTYQPWYIYYHVRY